MTSKTRLHGPAVRAWSVQHNGPGWQKYIRVNQEAAKCQRDEYPPVYLLEETDTAYANGGKDNAGGQAIRWIPSFDNGRAGDEFAHVCFNPPPAEGRQSRPP